MIIVILGYLQFFFAPINIDATIISKMNHESIYRFRFMWGLIAKMTVEGLMAMNGDGMPKAALAALNAKLNEYDVVE